VREIFSYISWILTELGYGIKPQSRESAQRTNDGDDHCYEAKICNPFSSAAIR
jgi:hypothetical protein